MWGSPSCTTPQELTPRCPTSGKGAGNLLWTDQPTWSLPTACCQPQVIYPIGLNGHNEPVITTLPEPLDSSISLIASEHIYLGIDIPSPPVEEPDQKMLPLKEIPTILVTSPPKSEGSMPMEVSNLLSQAALEVSSCESQHSSPRRPTTAVIFMSPPWKPGDLPWPANTSSQANINEGEASLEDVPSNISPITASSGSGSISPPVDLVELQTNAN